MANLIPIIRTAGPAVVMIVVASGMLVPAVGRAQITPEAVRLSIKRSSDFLLTDQTPDGHWDEMGDFPGGVTALVTLALLSAGVESDHPKIVKALDYLRGFTDPRETYSTALRTMALCAAGKARDRLLIERNVRYLESIQVRVPDELGGWDYGNPAVRSDESNTQFALLALHDAAEFGVDVRPQTWRAARTYWLARQSADGGWGYRGVFGSQGSTTCAGVASLTIIRHHLPEEAATIKGDTVDCCGATPSALQTSLSRGQAWLDSPRFSVAEHPSGRQATYLYYLYALERVGRLTGRRFYNGIDWYRAGAEILVTRQDAITGRWVGNAGLGEGQPHIATSFALLFLSKGRRPVVIAKMRGGERPTGGVGLPAALEARLGRRGQPDRDRHPLGIPRLVAAVESAWDRKLSWQTIDIGPATLEDLLETPILLISGRDGLTLTKAEKEKLGSFVEQGGFVLIEAAGGPGCLATTFDADVRAMLAEVFPGSPLKVLPPDHAVWFAEQKVVPDPEVPVLGLEACCRTSVIYVPANMSCYWSLAGADDEDAIPAAVAADVEHRIDLARNIVAYATGRELPEKLRPKVALTDTGETAGGGRAILSIIKLSHDGGADDARQALPNLQLYARRELGLRVEVTGRVIAPENDEVLLDHPLTFMHGRGSFTWTAAQRRAIGEYLDRGGFILSDAICASPDYATSFRENLTAAVPGSKFTRLPADHPLLTTALGGYDVTTVSVRETGVKDATGVIRPRIVRTAPTLEVLTVDDRIAVVFSPLDISCALERGSSPDCRGYVKEDAARLAMNILLFALRQ